MKRVFTEVYNTAVTNQKQKKKKKDKKRKLNSMSMSQCVSTQ